MQPKLFEILYSKYKILRQEKKSLDEDEYSLVHWLNKINLRHELQTSLPCLIKNKDAGVETNLYSLSLT